LPLNAVSRNPGGGSTDLELRFEMSPQQGLK
jgi:hypothetical protein